MEAYHARAVSLKTTEAISVSQSNGREERRTCYLHDDPTTFNDISFVGLKAKAECRLLFRYCRTVSQSVHTDICADAQLDVELEARALDGNATIGQYYVEVSV